MFIPREVLVPAAVLHSCHSRKCDCGMCCVTPQGTPEKGPLIRAGSPRRPATSRSRGQGSCDDTQTRGDDAPRDTSYSYVFPDSLSLRPVSTPWTTPAPDSAAVQPALHEPTYKPLFFEEVAGAKRLPRDCKHAVSRGPAVPCYEAAQDRWGPASLLPSGAATPLPAAMPYRQSPLLSSNYAAAGTCAQRQRKQRMGPPWTALWCSQSCCQSRSCSLQRCR